MNNVKNKIIEVIKNYKFRKIHLIPISFILMTIIFSVYVIVETSSDGPINGDRCDGVLAVGQDYIDQTISGYTNSNVSEMKINTSCRSIKISIKYTDETTKEQAKEIANEVLLSLDQTVGLNKVNESDKYSTLLTENDENTQYDVDFVLYGSNTGFPIFGTKHPSRDEVSFTDSDVRDPNLVKELEEAQKKEEQPQEE